MDELDGLAAWGLPAGVAARRFGGLM